MVRKGCGIRPEVKLPRANEPLGPPVGLPVGLPLPTTAQDAVRLVLQPEARIAAAMVLRAVALRNGLSSRVRSRKSNVPVPWMKVGPALLPLVSRRTHLASTEGT